MRMSHQRPIQIGTPAPATSGPLSAPVSFAAEGGGQMESGRRRTWLWVAAFVWPCVALAIGLAWYLVTSQWAADSDRRATRMSAMATAQSDAREVAEQRAAVSDSETVDLKRALSKALVTAAHEAQAMRDASVAASRMRADLADEKMELQALRNRSQAMPATATSAEPRPAGVLPVTVMVPVFDDGQRVLLPTLPKCDSMRFVNPMNVATIQSESMANGVPGFRIAAAGPLGVRASEPIGSVLVDAKHRLVFVFASSNPHMPAALAARTTLSSCGVSLYDGKDRMATVQLGEPTMTIRLSNSDARRQIAPPGCRLPPNVVLAAAASDDGWTSATPAGRRDVLHISRAQPALAQLVGFDVTFDRPSGFLTTNWTATFVTLNQRSTMAAADVKRRAVELSEAQDALQRCPSEPARTDAVSRTAWEYNRVESQGRVNEAQKAYAEADADRRTIEFARREFQALGSFSLQFIDPDSGLVLRIVRLVRN